jgi:lipid-A-disaccharide synthase
MKPRSFMLVAGEASGDLLAAELVHALRQELAGVQAIPTPDYQPLRASLEPRFFGAGGPSMAAAGVELAFDMTAHSVIGLSDVLGNYLTFRRLFHRLYELALERQPDAIICVDFAGFNRRFARAIKKYVRSHSDWFHCWNPKLIQYVSPQVWASREGRAYQIARDYDLLLSIIPFERAWFAKRVPGFRVEFVGHPMVDRYRGAPPPALAASPPITPAPNPPPNLNLNPNPNPNSNLNPNPPPNLPPSPVYPPSAPRLVLLPGSRPGELRRHLPILIEAAKRIAAQTPVSLRMVLPNETLARSAGPLTTKVPRLQVQVGGLAQALSQADLALTKSGTITLECAFFGVPAVVFYRTSPTTYLAARRIVKVKYLAMPNLLADQPLFPEFVQGAATAETLARAAIELLRDEPRRARIKSRLADIVASLGPPGASRRAARAIVDLLVTSRSAVVESAAFMP